jgi:hypothetical protein
VVRCGTLLVVLVLELRCRQPFPPETQEGLLHHVMIGHVGYINQGKFNFIFDAAQPLGPSRVRGKDVPDDFNFLEGLGQARRSPATCYDRDPCTEHWGFKYVSGLSAKAEARKCVTLSDPCVCVLNQT